MSIVSLAGASVLAVFLILVLRELRPSMALSARLATTVGLTGAALALCAPVVARMRFLLELGGGEGVSVLLLRALGVALVCELAAGFCRDLGEGGVADALTLFGKTEILVLSLPLIDDVLEMARELLKF